MENIQSFILLFNFLIILLLFSAILHLLWNRDILPKFLKKHFLIFLFCMFFSLIASMINNYLTITGIIGINLSNTIKFILIIFLSTLLIIPLMEIVFYFLSSAISTIKSKIIFIIFMGGVISLFLIPVPKVLYIYIGALIPLLSVGSIIFLRKRARELKRLVDPGILLIFRILLFTLAIIPFEIVELFILKSGFNMLIFGQVSIHSLSIISAIVIFNGINSDLRGSDKVPDLNEKFITGYKITPREREILLILLNGKSHREIGEKLNISPRTVDSHVLNIYKKCSIKSWKELFTLINS